MEALKREDVLRKVQKMLSLGKDKSAFEAEAKLAMQRAAEFLEAHGLTMKDVMVHAGKFDKAQFGKHYSAKEYAFWPWDKKLVRVAKILCPVDVLFNETRPKYHNLMWLGTKEDCEMADMLFQALRQNLKILSRGEETEYERRSFMMGCVDTLISRANELARARKGSLVESKALIHNKQLQVQQWALKAYERQNMRDGRISVDQEAFGRGQQAGRNVSFGVSKELSHG